MAFFTSTARCFDVLSDPLMAQAVRVLPGPRGLGTKQLTKSYGTVFHRGPDRIPWPSHFAQISDGFSSRFGRRRPFVLVGCILYALCLIATWLSTGMCQPILLNETCFIPLINPCIPTPVSKVAFAEINAATICWTTEALCSPPTGQSPGNTGAWFGCFYILFFLTDTSPGKELWLFGLYLR